MHLCSYAKHVNAVPDKNVQFWSHLTRAPSSHNVNYVWLHTVSFVSRGQKRLSSGNPSNEAVVMEVVSDAAFLNLVTSRCHQALQFFHCDP